MTPFTVQLVCPVCTEPFQVSFRTESTYGTIDITDWGTVNVHVLDDGSVYAHMFEHHKNGTWGPALVEHHREQLNNSENFFHHRACDSCGNDVRDGASKQCEGCSN